MQGTATEVGKMKFGYAHSPELTTGGQMVLVHKQILDCKMRRAQPTEALQEQTGKYGVDVDKAMEKLLKEMQQEVRRRQMNSVSARSQQTRQERSG